MARYILYALENQVGGTDRNYEDESGTIEHILPENPSRPWEQEFSREEQIAYVYRLGNLTLLEASKNNTECQNASYEEKLPIYKTSQYVMTNSLDYLDWAPEQIRLRQQKLAKVATSVWRI